MMAITSPEQLVHFFLVPFPQSDQLPAPTQDLGVPGIPLLVVKDDVPDCVEFPVLREELIPAQVSHGDVPYAHTLPKHPLRLIRNPENWR